jgi:hypothetical protein
MTDVAMRAIRNQPSLQAQGKELLCRPRRDHASEQRKTDANVVPPVIRQHITRLAPSLRATTRDELGPLLSFKLLIRNKNSSLIRGRLLELSEIWPPGGYNFTGEALLSRQRQRTMLGL